MNVLAILVRMDALLAAIISCCIPVRPQQLTSHNLPLLFPPASHGNSPLTSPSTASYTGPLSCPPVAR